MQADLEHFWQKAEDQFLTPEEIDTFRGTIDILRKRLEVYETLRDKEAKIFQAVADHLIARFPDENPKLLERALKHWISVSRYCAMATLLNDSDYLQHRLLEWLTDIVKVYRMERIIDCLHERYLAEAGEFLCPGGFHLLQPFLEQAKTTLLTQSTPIAA